MRRSEHRPHHRSSSSSDPLRLCVCAFIFAQAAVEAKNAAAALLRRNGEDGCAGGEGHSPHTEDREAVSWPAFVCAADTA
jgi:hypothetical protein